MALHTNAEGYLKSGGDGTVSMRKHSKNMHSFPAGIYLAGKQIEREKVKKFNDMGLNVKFETVTKRSNDNSMSNCIVLHKHHDNYINIETEHEDLSTHKKMIDRVMKILGQRSI